MYPFPSELITIISSYIYDFVDLDTFSHLFESRIDWINLIVLNYPQFYHVNIRDYRVKYVYYDFISSNGNCINYVPTYKETAQYLTSNDLFDDIYYVDEKHVIRYDDVEIYKIAYSQSIKEKDLLLSIENNAWNILKFIMHNFSSHVLYNNLCDALSNDYHGGINLNTIKIVIQSINFEDLDELEIKGILYIDKSQRNIFDLLLLLLPSDGLDTILLKDSLKNVLSCDRIYPYYFEQFYNKYNFIFDKEYISELINPLISNKFLYDGSIHPYDVQVTNFLKHKLERI